METFTENDVYSVSTLTVAIKNILEKNFNSITVKGEISNLKRQSSGHIYFSLKDENAQIFCAFFKGFTQNLKFMPKDGDKVIITGDVAVYPPRGNYQMIVKEMNLLGVGELLLKLHELKKKLKEKGYFEQSVKKPIPKFPKKIGVITSPTGAVIQDILNVLNRRFSSFHLILNPVRVQGAGSEREIARAILDFNKHNLADVIIVGRGGGSLEDLWSFNEEIVANAIFESKIPIISAVGHETDVSISDFVADVRAPTPSAAAEIAIGEKDALIKNFLTTFRQIAKICFFKTKEKKIKLQNIARQNVLSSPYFLLSKHFQKLDDLSNNFDFSIKNILTRYFDRLDFLNQRLSLLTPSHKVKILQQNLLTFSKRFLYVLENFLKIKKEKLFQLKSHLVSIDPKNLLEKGYSIIMSEKTNSLILSTKDVEKGDKITAIIRDGKIKAKVE